MNPLPRDQPDRDDGVRSAPPRWETFVERHAQRIQRAARRVCRDDDEAADVSADVLGSFHAAWPDLFARYRPDRGGRFETWLSVVARNAAIDCLRKRHGRDGRRIEEVPLDEVPEPADLKAPEDSHRLERARSTWIKILRSLRGDERVLLRLYFLEGRDAESLRRLFGGRTRSQIYNRVHALTKKLEDEARRAGLEADDVDGLAALDWGTILELEES